MNDSETRKGNGNGNFFGLLGLVSEKCFVPVYVRALSLIQQVVGALCVPHAVPGEDQLSASTASRMLEGL